MQKIYSFLFLFICVISHAQNIQVNRSYTPIQLVRDIFLGSSCIELDENSIEITGFNNSDYISYGYFEKGTSNFPLQNGILLTTGNLQNAVGPNNSIQSFAPSNWPGDSELEDALNLRRNSTHNATILEFDFISLQDDQINFEYIFASEQYLQDPNRSQCNYTDGFAFLIKEVDSQNDYTNIALVPNTQIPVKVNTVRGNGTICPAANQAYFAQFNDLVSPTNYNGQTVVLNATANIIPGRKYHIKLVIADETNGNYDSGVFLKAGSFSGVKDLGDDLLISNGNALCFGTNTTINATTPGAVGYQWYKDGIAIANAQQANYTITSPGYYEAEILLASGCSIKGNITVEYQDSIAVQQTSFALCDDDFDDVVRLNLADYNAQIIQGYTSSITVVYYSNLQDAQNQLNPISNLNLSSNTANQTVYARIKTTNCPPSIVPINFQLKPKSQAQSVAPITICDEDLNGQETINLDEYIDLIINNPNANFQFFATENDAKLSRNPINQQQVLSSNQTYFIRFTQGDFCPAISSISFILKQAKASTLLVDQTICPDTTTTLNAGPGFDSYLWLHNGATTAEITNIPVGNYHVRLEFNGCFYTQEVNVLASESPTIESIYISGSTVTVRVNPESDRILYALDDGEFQSSNIFNQVSLGQHIIYVKTIENCQPISQNFALIHRSNFISPNDDGKNDHLNYSDLMTKYDAKMEIFNRYGKLIFNGNSSNHFIWDGKYNGKKVASGSYWYRIQWKDTATDIPNLLTDWILVKHKN